MSDLNYLKIKDLSNDEKDALNNYKNASDNDDITGCFDLNLFLEYNLQLDDMQVKIKKSIINLDKALKRSPKLKSGITVYRAINQRLHYPNEIDKIFRNKGFWSTSLKKDCAFQFFKPQSCHSHGALLVLNLPKDFQAYNMETLCEKTSSGEDEILLPRNILWEVTSFKELKKDEINIMDHIKKKFINIAEITLHPK